MAGWPARFDGIVHTSLRYMASGSALAPSSNGRGGRRGRQQHVEALVGGLEVADDQRADLLGLAVVGVVVAGRQGVGAEHDAALHLGAEAGRAGAVVHLARGGGVDPQAVADAVVAGQVARRLGRGDEVVRRQAVDRGGHRHLLDLGAGRSRASAAACTRALTSGAMPSAWQSSVTRPTRSPSTPSARWSRTDGTGSGIEVESAGSWPAMTSRGARRRPPSAANGPIWSRLDAKATSP